MRHRFALAAFAFTTACANYDFSQARTIDGKLDTRKLIADLKASGEESLSEGIWIPLVYCNISSFKASTPGKPTGYEFAHWTGVGPVFMNGTYETALIDPAGTTIESDDRLWLGWSLLLNDRDGRIETIAGARLETTWRLLLLFGYDGSVFYASRS
ncbi:MAG: hypothetical protein JNK78_00515 [Planctomycetes bacterium]|nr:hypothetical protein [Planctomycetota bacterium]